jgi:hypothetical protein
MPKLEENTRRGSGTRRYDKGTLWQSTAIKQSAGARIHLTVALPIAETLTVFGYLMNHHNNVLARRSRWSRAAGTSREPQLPFQDITLCSQTLDPLVATLGDAT